MYLGRTQLGQTLPLWLQCCNASGVPTVPDDPPSVRVYAGASLVTAGEMPVHDRYQQTGLFFLPLFLGSGFTTGSCQAVFLYRVSSFYGLEAVNFDIVAGGHQDGAVTGLYYYQRPQADFLVQVLGETGQIVKGRNPQVR